VLAERRPSCVAFILRRDVSEDRNERRVRSPQSLADSNAEYTIGNIKEAYGIPADLLASNESTLQMVWGPGTFGYSKMQLFLHKKSQCPLLNMDKVKFDTPNHGRSGGDNYGEGNLDTKMIASFGLNVETIVSNTNTSASTETLQPVEGDYAPADVDCSTAKPAQQPNDADPVERQLSKRIEQLCSDHVLKMYTDDLRESFAHG